MDLDAIVKSQPVFVLGSAFVAGGGLVAGVMAYFASQAQSRAEAAAKADASLAAQKATAEQQALKEQLRDTAGQYKLLERKVGTDIAVVDLGKLLISQFDVMALGSDFKSFEEGRFRARVPQSGDWHYEYATEAAVFAEGVVDIPEGLAPLFALPPKADSMHLHSWRKGDGLETTITDALPGDPLQATLRFYPRAFVQYVADGDLPAIFAPPPDLTPEQLAAAQPQGPQVAARLQATLTANFLLTYLTAQLSSSFSQSAMFLNIASSFETIRKAGPVIYARMRSDFAGPPETRLSVIREWFIVKAAGGYFLIRIELPTRDGTTDDVAWTNEWITGLRFVSGD